MANAHQGAYGHTLPPAVLMRSHGPSSLGPPGSSALEGLRCGEFGGRVGLLPGLHSKLMDKYSQANEKRPRRAPREDISHLTAEERVQRRKIRARFYSTTARDRQDQQHRELEGVVSNMRIFQSIVEESAQMVVMLSTNIHCLVLYANKRSTDLLGLSPVGSSFVKFVHVNDRRELLANLSTVILTTAKPVRPIRCRLRLANLAEYQAFDLAVAYGTQGLVCTFWHVMER